MKEPAMKYMSAVWLVSAILSATGCVGGDAVGAATDDGTSVPRLSILPTLTVDRAGRQEVEFQIRNNSSKDFVYIRQQWPTPIYYLCIDAFAEGTRAEWPTPEGVHFSQTDIRTLAPGRSISCEICMTMYDLPGTHANSLPVGRYRMNVFYRNRNRQDYYEKTYGVTLAALNRPVALIDLVNHKRNLKFTRQRWLSGRGREAERDRYNPRNATDYSDDANSPLTVMPIVRFRNSREVMDVQFEIQNDSGRTILYRRGNGRNPVRNLELSLIRQDDGAVFEDGASPPHVHSVTALGAYQSIAVSKSLKDFGCDGTGEVPPGRYELRAKYRVDDRLAAEERITAVEFDRTVLVIDVVDP